MSKEIKQIRGQIRQIVQEILPELLSEQLVKEMEKRIDARLKSIDQRQKDLQLYMIRQNTQKVK